MRLSREPLFTAAQIQARVRELSASVSSDFDGRDIVALVVLKGAIHFGSDLVRSLTIPVLLDFIRAKSYADTAPGQPVEFLSLPTLNLAGKHVLILEDILDTGRTASAILEYVGTQRPSGISFCTLLDKPSRRETEVTATYVGFEIGDAFVVGYGMDYNEEYRALPNIYVLEGAD